jgi:hypothetical protein
MKNKDWSLTTEENKEHGTCIHIIINKDVPIEGLMFKLLDEERKLITSTKVLTREIYLCTSLAKPEFAQLDDCVKYVEGSGKDYYKQK